MELKDFVGLHEYGGVELGTNPENDAEYVIFMLDGNCYKIEEDPDDGWRSYAKDVEEYGVIDKAPKMEAKTLVMFLAPKN